MRLLPVAPFTVVNVVSGAFQVPLWPYFLGSLLGMAPGIILINLFAHEIEIAIENPGAGGCILLGALIVISVLATLWLRLKSGKDKAEKKNLRIAFSSKRKEEKVFFFLSRLLF
jgi:phospholipase D1/2